MKKSSLLKKMMYLLVIIIFVLIIYLAYMFISNYMNKNNNHIDDSLNKLDGKVVLYNNYLYLIPNNIFYKIDYNKDGNPLHLYNNEWGAFINLIDINKQEKGIFDDFDKLEEELKKDGDYTISNRKVANRNGIEVVTFEIYADKTNGLYAYMPAYDNYEYGIIMYDGDNKSMNYEALNTVLDVLIFGMKNDIIN